jgi:Tol biopolymer transport system component
MRKALPLLLALVACGSSSGAPDGGADTGVDVAIDAPDSSGPTCDTSKPFGAPVLITELSTTEHDLFPRLTHDELTVYFERYPSADAGIGSSDIYVATRASLAAPFGAATKLPGGINGSSNEFDPSVTADNLTLFFASNRAGSAGVDIWMSTRADTASPFGAPATIAIDTAVNEHSPYVLADGLTLYFTGTAGSSLLRATRASSSAAFALDTSGLLDGINTTNNEVGPAVTPDELTLYFGSQRAGSQMFDVYVATRTSTSSPFGSIARVDAVDTAGNDLPGWISDDGCRLYLHSDVAGSYDIYVATKP